MNTQKNKKFSNKAKAAALGLAVMATGTVGTLALLTDTSTTDINISSADFGITVNDSADGNYEVAFAGGTENLKPGDVRSGDITITNDSTIDAAVTVTAGDLEGFTAAVTNVDDSAFAGVTLAQGESVTLTVDVALPASATTSPADEVLNLTVNAAQV